MSTAETRPFCLLSMNQLILLVPYDSAIRENKRIMYTQLLRKESERIKYNRDDQEVELYFQNEVLGFSVQYVQKLAHGCYLGHGQGLLQIVRESDF